MEIARERVQVHPKGLRKPVSKRRGRFSEGFPVVCQTRILCVTVTERPKLILSVWNVVEGG